MHGAARMTVATTEFLLPSEVQEITRLRDPTRRRMEKRGLFPARIHAINLSNSGKTSSCVFWPEPDPEGEPGAPPLGAGQR
jgi:hypothetical protein